MLSNWGIFDSNNYIELINENPEEPKFKRTLLYGNEKSSFSDKEEPFEYYIFLKNSIKLKDRIMNNLELIDEMIIHFKDKTFNFIGNLRKICKKYGDFIKNNIKNNNIEDEELKNELNIMISKIENVLIYRYNFFNKNMEKIKEQMIECIEDSIEFSSNSSNSISGGERRIPVESRSSGKSNNSRKNVSSEKVLSIKELNILAKITKNITIMNKSKKSKKIPEFMNNTELISKNHFNEIMNKHRIISKKVIKLEKNKIRKSLNSSELSKEKTY
jgi:hypothetical protein